MAISIPADIGARTLSRVTHPDMLTERPDMRKRRYVPRRSGAERRDQDFGRPVQRERGRRATACLDRPQQRALPIGPAWQDGAGREDPVAIGPQHGERPPAASLL